MKAKPHLFIGSSVEGLNIAYPVQQNLMHDAEVTVWDQGVFELSKTTIESLNRALDENDFAIFVFTPDDVVQMRNVSHSSVRDNVLFEFGLFIGRLGRERVFFMLPNDSEFHLPTDLLGITPAKYDPRRADGSMQAATGPACHQIRKQIASLGAFPGRQQVAERAADTPSESRPWFTDLIEGNFADAKKGLEAALQSQSGDDSVETKAWITYCEAKLDDDGSMSILHKFATQHENSTRVQSLVAGLLRLDGRADEALKLLSSAKSRLPEDVDIARGVALAHVELGDINAAVAELKRFNLDKSPEIALELADIFEKEDQKKAALEILQAAFVHFPGNKRIRFQLARAAQELNLDPIALGLLDDLTKEEPKSLEYWGYLANSCLHLGLHDKAMRCYRRAQALMKPTQQSQWITSNIGNLLNVCGLASDAKVEFEKALKHEPLSEYAHERMALALKKIESEQKLFEKKSLEGKRELRAAIRELSASNSIAAPALTEPSTTLLTSV